MTTLAMKINILSPTNEMQFTDRKKFFTDRILLFRSVRIDKSYVTTLAMKINILSPTNEMQFTDGKISLRTVYISLKRSVRIEKPYMTFLAMKMF